MNSAEQTNQIRDIFDQVVELPPAERGKLLAQACGSSPELLAAVQSLLDAYDRAGQFLADPSIPASRLGIVEFPAGSKIGPYTLLQVIGEGGYGTVYLAQQDLPLRRRVALKIVKAGMDTKQVLARFDLERQALAMMDHPNIARVFDAGTTDTGRPFFVMELVNGLPITDFCRKHKVALGWRLKIFYTVCSAVQHAHKKGIIHRDLKPGNVLIAVKDGRPSPKIIDFGIAKALAMDINPAMTIAYPVQFLGTPQYMSPEQSLVPGVEIDARSDVYSLGAMLYELLTDAPPFDPQQMRAATFTDVNRILREVEPPPPSVRANNRKLRGDLDWIVIKAMEKDRNRRYESVEALAKDVAHYLADEPISARPPSKIYRAEKFIVRHRRSLITAAIVLIALIVGFGLANLRSQSTPAIVPIATTQPEELIPGLVARLYNGSKFDSLVKTRIDSHIDFFWPRRIGPGEGVLTPHYSIRWDGVLVVPPGGASGIGISVDDGGRLTIDGNQVIAIKTNKSIYRQPLAAGRHAIQIEYWNDIVEGRARLLWILKDDTEEVVPGEALFHTKEMEGLK